jgi:hypothetical protein
MHSFNFHYLPPWTRIYKINISNNILITDKQTAFDTGAHGRYTQKTGGRDPSQSG